MHAATDRIRFVARPLRGLAAGVAPCACGTNSVLCRRGMTGAILIAVAAVFLLLSGCRSAPHPPDPIVWATPRTDGCVGVYVVLPANYSLYVEEGLLFESGGTPEDLPVYCTPGEANRVLETLELQAERVQHLWRVYQLEADWDADVVRLGTEYRLTHPARIFSVEHPVGPSAAVASSDAPGV